MKEKATAFAVGATGYPCIEILARGHTHWSMALLGGICVLALVWIARRYPGMNIAVGEMDELQGAHEADIVSDDAVETKPNFVITVDPNLTAEPDDTAVEQRAAEQATPKKKA